MRHPTLQVQEFVALAPYTTLRIGGSARFFVQARSQAELLEAVGFARERSLPIFTLGGGSNLLVPDEGFPGVVIHAALDGVARSWVDPESGETRVSVPAGMVWDDFVRSVCKQGVSGVECMAGIPGLVGGSPIQNIGAYGQEVASRIVHVTALDLASLEFVVLSAEECRFAYRSSIFNTTHRGRYIVTGVDFRFDPSAKPNLTYADLQKHFAGAAEPTPMDVYHAVREIRHGKGMLIVEGEPDCRSAGSFFKNPVVPVEALGRISQALGVAAEAIPHWPAGEGMIKLPAAWLLDQAGFHKGYAMGAAGISSRHTLALINRGGASFADIAALRDEIQRVVLERFGIGLEQEPVLVGG